jgi:hypothetical protein
MQYHLLIFESSHQVMKADHLLMQHAMPFDLIPTPKAFSSDCGLSVRCMDPSQVPAIVDLLKSEGLHFREADYEME